MPSTPPVDTGPCTRLEPEAGSGKMWWIAGDPVHRPVLVAESSPVWRGLFVGLPLLVLEPGPAPDVARRTKIDAVTYPSEGSIHLTTAQVRSPRGATRRRSSRRCSTRTRSSYSEEAIYPPDESHEHTESIQAAQMTQSELEAAVAALNELGMPLQGGGRVRQRDRQELPGPPGW